MYPWHLHCLHMQLLTNFLPFFGVNPLSALAPLPQSETLRWSEHGTACPEVAAGPIRFRQKLKTSRTQIYIWAHRASSKATKRVKRNPKVLRNSLSNPLLKSLLVKKTAMFGTVLGDGGSHELMIGLTIAKTWFKPWRFMTSNPKPISEQIVMKKWIQNCPWTVTVYASSFKERESV